MACPYNARFVHPATSVVDKCTFCAHRIDEGRQPACVEACPTRALVFGDLNDPRSEITGLLGTAAVQTLKASLGARPKVHYVNADERTFGRLRLPGRAAASARRYAESMPADVIDSFEKCRDNVY